MTAIMPKTARRHKCGTISARARLIREVMAVYTYCDGYRHSRNIMSRKTQITLTDRQHAFLADESGRSGLSIAELVRRAIDTTYRPHARPRVPGLEVSLGLWRRPDEALLGRRPQRRV
jgi:hypothetical protein